MMEGDAFLRQQEIRHFYLNRRVNNAVVVSSYIFLFLFSPKYFSPKDSLPGFTVSAYRAIEQYYSTATGKHLGGS
jgi:hypothetical protein